MLDMIPGLNKTFDRLPSLFKHLIVPSCRLFRFVLKHELGVLCDN